MAYLSKIPLNYMRRGAQSLLRDPRAMHAAVLGGLASQPVRERVLWRPEIFQHRCELLVLTQTRPSWESVIEQAGWADSPAGAAVIRDYQPLLDGLAAGRRFGFRLRANPTVAGKQIKTPTVSQRRRLADESAERGVRVGLWTVQRQLEWFLKRAAGDAAAWGFTVGPLDTASVSIVGRSRERFTKRDTGLRVSLDTATYEGVLTVVDVPRLRDVLTTGIGSGKAYGCGLLTLAPAAG